MSRELHVPILLWVCAGLVVHLLGGSGIVGVTIVEEKKAEERAAIREMVWDVRRELGVVQLDMEGALGEEQPPEDQLVGEDESLLAFTLRLLSSENAAEEEVPAEAEELDPWKAWVASMILQPKEEEAEPEKQPLPAPEPPAEEKAAAAEPEKQEPKPEAPTRSSPGKLLGAPLSTTTILPRTSSPL
jgi:hypothetical protein